LTSVKSEVNSFFSRNELYRKIGASEIESSTVTRLFQLKKNNPAVLDAALCFLQVADIFNYLLSGELCAEYTLSTTSQLIDPDIASWNADVFSKLGLPVRLAPPLVDSGTFLGHISEARMQESGICEASVYAACCHDSAAVMVAMPLISDDTLYISSGSWSVVMLRIDKPLLDRKQIPVFMHEGNWGRKPRLVRNIIGLWMVQQLSRETGINYDDLEVMAASSHPFASVFVPEAVNSFSGDIMPAISEACAKSGQIVPQTPGDFLRAIYDSLALRYRELVKEAGELLGYPLRSVCVAGGGARSDILNGATAETTGLPVMIGPIEAAVAGNICSQMIAHGEIGGMSDISEILRNSFGEKRFVPSGRFSGAIDRAAEIFSEIKRKFLTGKDA
jgi:sugar (pentulose or hexulose) kinase